MSKNVRTENVSKHLIGNTVDTSEIKQCCYPHDWMSDEAILA